MLFLRTLDFLPADVLDVVIAADSQPDAPSQASPLKHLATICTCHALAKTMHAHAAADLRLVRTFNHFSFLTLKIIALGSVSNMSGWMPDLLFQDRQVIIP